MAKNACIDWVTHPKLDWEYVIIMLEKVGELLWPTPQPFTQNGELCLICYSPFGPKGAWILNTCQHIYHLQCWFYQMFQGLFNPKTNKFEYSINPMCAWYNMMGVEIG
jgi:hypothetical protein